MLTLRRVSTVYQYIYPLSSYQYRFKSRKSINDESKQNNEQENRLDKKQSTKRETFLSNANDNDNQTEDLLRTLNVKNLNQRKKSFDQNNRVNLAKPFNPTEKKQKREGDSTGQKQKKIRPHVILDTESNEVKTLTRQVAESLTPANSPNDSSHIEQELLDVLRGHRVVSKSARRNEKKTENFQQKQTEKRSPITPEANTEKTTDAFSSLLRDIKLKSSDSPAKPTLDEDFVRDVLDGATVRPKSSDDREKRRDFSESRRPIRDTKRRQEYLRPQRLWSGESLGIFTKKDPNDVSTTMSAIWEKYEQDELTRISTIPPRNAFEEMIQWTKDGILWKFPIDNEQDIGPEADVPFYEHVLLERHLHDFPESPLIRQFMELVCVGLGRNPYWTAEQKLEHINWFRKFFSEKTNVFNETVHTGTIKTSASPSTPKPVSTYKPKPAPPPSPPKVVPVVPPPSTTAAKTPAASKK